MTDLSAAKAAVDAAQGVVDGAIAHLAATGSIDDQQVIAYDLAHAAAAVETGRAMLSYGEKGELEAKLTCAYIADAIADLVARLVGREGAWGVSASDLSEAGEFVNA